MIMTVDVDETGNPIMDRGKTNVPFLQGCIACALAEIFNMLDH
jgi:hypothetical protein